MPSTIPNVAQSLLNGNVLRFARLWKLTRKDGLILRFADHPEPIYWEGNKYTPALFDSSASEHNSGFEENNIEIVGGISSAAISEQDLKAGLYNNCRVEETLVDWKYPLSETVGFFRRDVFIVDGIQYSGEIFQGDLLSISGVLTRRSGDSLNRDCPVSVGSDRCGLDIPSFSVSGTVSSVSENRRVFTTNLPDPDGRYDDGELVFNSGLNDGFVMAVKRHLNAGGQIEFQVRAPYPINAADTFDIVPGCGQVREDCKGTSGTKNRPWLTNIENFQGFPDMPGSTTILKTPNG